jgi:mevalonate kinase
MTFAGSGYDIACAKNNSPITYQLTDIEKKQRIVKQAHFNPAFKEHLSFVYLNKKQDSQKAVKEYKNKVIKKEIIEEVTAITKAFISSTSLNEFCELMIKHEQLLSQVLELQPIKERLFSDFNGAIKSLGAWGGDFILVASKESPERYFREKGYNTILSYEEMILN